MYRVREERGRKQEGIAEKGQEEGRGAERVGATPVIPDNISPLQQEHLNVCVRMAPYFPHYRVHYFGAEPYVPWLNVVHHIGDRVPFVT